MSGLWTHWQEYRSDDPLEDGWYGVLASAGDGENWVTATEVVGGKVIKPDWPIVYRSRASFKTEKEATDYTYRCEPGW